MAPTKRSARRGLPVRLALAAGLVLIAAVGTGASGPAPGAGRAVPGPRQSEARAALPVEGRRLTGFAERVRTHLYQGAFGRSHARLPDFTGYRDVRDRKHEFFSWMLPLVAEENARLGDIRRRLTWIFDHARWGHGISDEDRRWLADLAREFRIRDDDPGTPEFWRTAFERVDALPEDLVVVQAANESAWGTSRFAREGNNLFGQWCFRPGCGIVPMDRPDGASYEVARFGSPGESVGSYMRNLNTGASYQKLREIRARDRARGRPPRAEDLAAGLVDYSERGDEYVAEIRSMIRTNRRVIAQARAALAGARDEEG
jgi:Bax protein